MAISLAISLQPYIGASQSELEWNIASGLLPSSTPNVLSELQFKELSSAGGGFHVELQQEIFSPRLNFILEGEFNFDHVNRGHGVDTDYYSNNRTNPYSISRSNIEGNSFEDYLGGMGLSYQIVPQRFSLALFIGLAHKEQNLNFQNGRQVFADAGFFFPTTVDELNDILANELDSDYFAEWKSYWVALEGVLQNQSATFYTRLRIDNGTYYGEGRWNLRSSLKQPKSFSHHADSQGWQWEIGMNYQLTQATKIHLTWLHGEWEADAGLDNTYFTNDTIQTSRLNEATWKSSQLRLGWSYEF